VLITPGTQVCAWTVQHRVSSTHRWQLHIPKPPLGDRGCSTACCHDTHDHNLLYTARRRNNVHDNPSGSPVAGTESITAHKKACAETHHHSCMSKAGSVTHTPQLAPQLAP
jgi:hypothetical protein